MNALSKMIIFWLGAAMMFLATLFIYELQKAPPPTPQEQLRDLEKRADQGDVHAAVEVCNNNPAVNATNYSYCLTAAQYGDERSLRNYIALLGQVDRDCDYIRKVSGKPYADYNADKAERGDTNAQFKRGFDSYTGYTCSHEKPDYADAYFWFLLASKARSLSADGVNYITWKEKAASQLASEQRALIERRVLAWKPAPNPPSCKSPDDCKDFCKGAGKGKECMPDGVPACAKGVCGCGLTCR